MQDRALYSIQEARKLLGGISRNTIYRLLRTGELASVVIGCRRFISPSAIAELVARSTTTISPSLASTRSRLAAKAVLPLPTTYVSVEVGLCGLGIDFVRRGICVPKPRHARHATAITCNSVPASPAGETWRCGSNTPLAQRELRARGRNWFEGRIAECPRLQQNGSSDDLTFSCKNFGSSML